MPGFGKAADLYASRLSLRTYPRQNAMALVHAFDSQLLHGVEKIYKTHVKILH